MPEKPPRGGQGETEAQGELSPNTEKAKPTVSKQQAKQQAQRPLAPSEVAAEKAAAETLPATVRPVQQAPVPIMPGNLEGLWRLSDALARAKILPDHLTDNGRADYEVIKANVFWVIQCGAELDIPACQAIMGIAIINGRPCVYGDLMIGKVRASGLADYIRETSEGSGDDLVCYCEARRRDTGEVIVRSYSWAEADKVVQRSKRFGDKKLTEKDTYRNYGPRMIAMRARAYCLRDGFSDVLKGIRMADEEEDQAYVSGPVQPLEAPPPRPQPPKAEKAIEGEIVDAPEAEDPEQKRNDYQISAEVLISSLGAAANAEDLDALWDNSLPVYEDLPGDLRRAVLGEYEELRDGLVQSPLAAG